MKAPIGSRALPRPGSMLEVFAVAGAVPRGPLGGPVLRTVGSALVQPDGSIIAWLDASPVSGTLLLRPVPLSVCQASCSSGEDGGKPVRGGS